ncbi:MAG: hypothetical protein HY433_01835 [Candidatus Liptonbacteria bacterium]|nr:hypothetical protein [Candidatus Liptonbacteria bacterium]
MSWLTACFLAGLSYALFTQYVLFVFVAGDSETKKEWKADRLQFHFEALFFWPGVLMFSLNPNWRALGVTWVVWICVVVPYLSYVFVEHWIISALTFVGFTIVVPFAVGVAAVVKMMTELEKGEEEYDQHLAEYYIVAHK